MAQGELLPVDKGDRNPKIVDRSKRKPKRIRAPKSTSVNVFDGPEKGPVPMNDGQQIP